MTSKNVPPPPGYGFQPQPGQVVYAPPTTAMVMPLGPDTCNVTCPSCNASVATRVEKETTTKTHLFALLLCILFCPLSLIPYCSDCCKATNHYCPSCGAFLGTYDH
ncbi:lipopolysaccharide-induced tumor necrosis factor-alpha factor homolog [Homalodisca vitripennis]|uniref:LITAF domain-containing protein n=1 Tax=Homalodisca liturata TaxID=320908 RepID=A0A1B6HDV3_9HEMI|nr:lipopolysaccharide-induced tumor necrosis factor-alpha factor homolog [Homalodisca vitripennis]